VTERWRVELGDCIAVLERMPADSVDAVVTDPPYGLEFMGQAWDRPWAVSSEVPVGFAGREGSTLPSHRDGRNANCRRCGGRARGENRCECPEPAWDRAPAQDMRDFQAWCEVWARACWRVLKPGGMLLAFGGTRTAHRLACGIEDAGFEIRDRVLTLNGHVLGAEVDWIYGSGWPKSRNIGKAIDARAGAEREVIGTKVGQPGYSLAESKGGAVYGDGIGGTGDPEREAEITAPATPEAAKWEGWGTALKPAHEPIIVARKPCRGTVEAQVLATGTGALNIDACRIDSGPSPSAERRQGSAAHLNRPHGASGWTDRQSAENYATTRPGEQLGRWPANVCLVHSPDCERVGERRVPSSVTVRRHVEPGTPEPGIFPKRAIGGDDVTFGDGDGMETVEAWDCAPGCPVAQLNRLSGELSSGDPTAHGDPARRNGQNTYMGESRPEGTPLLGYGDRGGASRFYYSGKASPVERDAGLEGFDEREAGQFEDDAYAWATDGRGNPRAAPVSKRNIHPTVKPIELMRWLVRLVAPKGAVVLDPFAGSGSTGCAAALEGVRFVGIERDEAFAAIARARVTFWAGFPVGTPVARVLAEENARRRGRDEAHERQRDARAAGQLDLLAGAGE